MDITASQEEKYRFVMDIASGQLNFDKIIVWLNTHAVKSIG